MFRIKHAADKNHEITQFSSSTSTGTLRRHLYLHHVAEWVVSCDAQKIQITARDAQSYVESYRQSIGQQSPHSSRIPFSQETFTNALVEFIVGDDQVCIFFLNKL